MAVLNGSEGADTLTGGNGDDTLNGLGGNDRLLPGAGNDTIDGGDGNDEINGFGTTVEAPYSFYTDAGTKTVRGGNGNDFVVGAAGSDAISGDAGDDVLFGRGGNDTISGGTGNDGIRGDEGDDSLDGGAGNDTLIGGTGNDTIAGGSGADVLWGLGGDDTFVIDDINDVVMDAGAGDRVVVNADFVKVPGRAGAVSYAAGVQALPYWIDALVESSRAYVDMIANHAWTYAFPSALPAYDTSAGDAFGWQAFSADDRTHVATLFSYLSGVLDLQFTPVATVSNSATNQFTFQRNTQAGSAGYASYPSTNAVGSDVFIAHSVASMASGTQGAATLTHEVAHALGLKHPHALGTPAADGPFLSAAEDIRTNTIMSYTGMGDSTVWQLALRDLDLAALQYLYGPSRNARTGNDTYTLGTAAANFIWDGAGTDTIDGSALAQSLTLDLRPGSWGFIGAKAATITAAGQVTVNFGSAIENAVGTRQADAITGNELANQLTGGGGNDTLVGGAGADVAVYTGTRANYTIAYDRGTATFTVTDVIAGRDGADQLRQVESLRFADRTVSTDTLAVEAGSRAELLLAMGVYRGLHGAAPNATAYAQAITGLASGTPSAYALGTGAGFTAQAGDVFTDAVLANFGVTTGTIGGPTPAASYTALKEALVLLFTLYASARGQVVLNMTTLLGGLEGDAVFGGVARSWNSRVAADLTTVSGSALVDGGDGLLALVGVPDAM